MRLHIDFAGSAVTTSVVCVVWFVKLPARGLADLRRVFVGRVRARAGCQENSKTDGLFERLTFWLALPRQGIARGCTDSFK
ncbi:hypothetical protein DBV39_03250 [Orrella marina]|uniref:Uncharacterized protein n=1 Tax=Orrella marina TaxID=2163011 RepID=A0A2R4XGH5_9BURK|nr:hypothetical protein DBV39_03250 [Orrella marina]